MTNSEYHPVLYLLGFILGVAAGVYVGVHEQMSAAGTALLALFLGGLGAAFSARIAGLIFLVLLAVICASIERCTKCGHF